MRYQEITELFDNKAGWKWTRSSDHETTADFSIGDAFYQVGFGIVAHDGYGNNPTWEVAFEDSDGDFNLTGNGNAFAVFATVADIILDFIKKATPYKLQFSASTKEPSRVTVYRKMASKLATKVNYSLSETESHGDIYYVLTKN
jgi:hypothetical protein